MRFGALFLCFAPHFYTYFPKGHPKVAHRSPIGRPKVNHKCYKGAPEVKRDHYVRTLHYIHTTELTAIKARLKSEKLKKCAKNALFLCIKTQMTYFGSKKAKIGSILLLKSFGIWEKSSNFAADFEMQQNQPYCLTKKIKKV